MADWLPSKCAGIVDGIRASFAYFSRIPIGTRPVADSAWSWAAAHLPLVGIVIGCASAGVFFLVSPLGHALAASFALATTVVLSGALHEDGLADSADALGAAHSGKQALAIMKDSRIGVFGAVALGLSLLIRYSALVQLNKDEAFACVLVAALARIPPIWLLATERRIGTDNSAPQRAEATRAQVLTAASWGVACVALGTLGDWVSWPVALAVCASLPPLALLAARFCRRTFGGITGDLLGATEQIAEIVCWLVWLTAAHNVR